MEIFLAGHRSGNSDNSLNEYDAPRSQYSRNVRVLDLLHPKSKHLNYLFGVFIGSMIPIIVLLILIGVGYLPILSSNTYFCRCCPFPIRVELLFIIRCHQTYYSAFYCEYSFREFETHARDKGGNRGQYSTQILVYYILYALIFSLLLLVLLFIDANMVVET